MKTGSRQADGREAMSRAPRPLSPDEEALWRKAMADVRPLRPARAAPERQASPGKAARLAPGPADGSAANKVAAHEAINPAAAEGLDGHWDRRIRKGRIAPELVLDLHGMTREEARKALYAHVALARRRGARTLLVITGKGGTPGPEPADLMGLGRAGQEQTERGPDFQRRAALRGSIRADLPRWLGERALAAEILAVRRAHPRHGGGGALYLILRR